MNANVNFNFSRLRPTAFLLPVALLIVIGIWLFCQNALNVEGYIAIQKESFFFLNRQLAEYPRTLHNLTQFGDALVFLSLLSTLAVYEPQVWGSLLSALIVSMATCLIKLILAVPRPSAVLDSDKFVVIGETLCGHNSVPSGHSTTIFTILTVLLFGFFPRKAVHRILFLSSFVLVSLLLVMTRVSVGAHYPLDVIIGSIVGYISGLSGIFICRKYRWWHSMGLSTYYPLCMLVFGIFGVLLINRMMLDNLVIYYFALAGLGLSLYKTIRMYAQK